MIQGGVWSFEHRRVLLLQGPVGPFFRRLSRDLRKVGAEVFKINFNGGDVLFYPRGGVLFQGTEEEWPEFLEKFINEKQIEIVMLFGDCRTPHRLAHEICQKKGIEIGVFEEGYVRPDYISFERFGVNGNSRLPRVPSFYLNQQNRPVHPAMSVGTAFWYAMTWAMIYNTASGIFRFISPQYRHHRTLTVTEGLFWLRSLWRKVYYAKKEERVTEALMNGKMKEYFLVPLQVHNDAQIWQHSQFEDVEDFIEFVLKSFAEHAPKNLALIFKHHPLDRGCRDYSELIYRLMAKFELKDRRIYYIHDQHLPTLIRHSRGVVVINSTVGMSAIGHDIPVKICGRAIYDIEGLVYSGSLEDFWHNPQPGNRELYDRFRNFLIRHTQLNGNFYRRLPLPDSSVGIRWT